MCTLDEASLSSICLAIDIAVSIGMAKPWVCGVWEGLNE